MSLDGIIMVRRMLQLMGKKGDIEKPLGPVRERYTKTAKEAKK
jgi:hypothetical protein